MPKPGDLLMGRYRIIERIGSGGMATVHRARDERLDRDVAIKILLPNLAADPSTAARFEREARSLAASSHPGVVAVFDVDAGDSAAGREPFFVMEICRGGSLADRLGPGTRMTPDDLVPVLVAVADGLADLHRRGIVHRDIKPQNILFADDRPKLADFGLAQSSDGGELSELTTPGTTVGTLAYLAPEVLAGQRATPASDVYALGVVAFVGLTGSPPRPATSMAELIGASTSEARPVSTVVENLGPAFDDVVGAALATDPSHRPDALAFASGLATALGRWTRDGGPGRRSEAAAEAAAAAAPLAIGPPDPAEFPDPAELVAVGRLRAGDRSPVDDATTALAIPVGATSSLPLDGAVGRPPGPRSSTGAARLAIWFGRATIVVALIIVVVALAGVLNTTGPGGAPTPPVAGASAGSIAPSASPSVAPSPSPSVASPSPSADAVLASLAAMDDAINAARGGPDGLKGKDANDLQSRTASIRRALDGGDRAAALDLARKLDRRVADLAKGLAGDLANRLRAASQDLVRTLGG